MTLAVGYGHSLEYLLDLPLPAFDALTASIERVRKQTLADLGRVTYLAAQCKHEDLEKHLSVLEGTSRKIEATEHKAAREAMNAEGNRPRRRGKR